MSTDVAQLQQELADAKNLIASLESGAKAPGSTKSKLKKIGASIAAAFTTPEAIKAEKYLGVVALTRLALLLPSAAVLVDLLVNALGGPSVKP